MILIRGLGIGCFGFQTDGIAQQRGVRLRDVLQTPFWRSVWLMRGGFATGSPGGLSPTILICWVGVDSLCFKAYRVTQLSRVRNIL